MKPHRQHQFITILFIVSLIFLPIPFSWAQDEATPEVTQPLLQETPLVEPSPNPADILPTLEPTPLPTETPIITATVEPTVTPTVEITESVEPTALPTIEVTPEITAPPVIETPIDDTTSSLDALLVSPLVVTNTNDSGLGSLRGAIEYANSNPGADTITFNIPGDGPYTIRPESILPIVTDTITINGLSQSGANCDSWPPTLKIELTGNGLYITADNSVVQGMVINQTYSLYFEGSHETVTCNFLGTDVTGTIALGNTYGVSARDYATITHNLISGNYDTAINIYGASGQIKENLIGVDITGVQPLGNGRSGSSPYAIFVSAPEPLQGQSILQNEIAKNLIAHNYANGIGIGDFHPDARPLITENIIRHNSGVGISTGISAQLGVQIQSNQIYSNGGLGIDHGGYGVSPNDPPDSPDTEAPNFPILNPLPANGTEVSGSLKSYSNTAFTIQLFENDTCDGSGYGEGQTLISEFAVNSDANGLANFSISVPPLVEGKFITATSSSVNGTSEFSPCVLITGEINPVIVTNTNDSGIGSLRNAIIYANLHSGADTISFNIPGDGPHTIQPQSPLPTITDTATIDGLSQPGANCDTWPPTLKIEIDGSQPLNNIGLKIAANQSLVQGLVINRTWVGIQVKGIENVLTCNYIGTDINGTVGLPTSGGISGGISIEGDYTTITRNLATGIGVAGAYNAIRENRVGVDSSGTQPSGYGGGIGVSNWRATLFTSIPNHPITRTEIVGNHVAYNERDGISINILTGYDQFGDLPLIANNVIAFNGENGVASVPNAQILNNQIYSNGKLGINLGSPGPDSYRLPSLNPAAAGDASVTGSLQSTIPFASNTQFTIQLFTNQACDFSGYGEGETIVGEVVVTTDANGSATFGLPVPPLTEGQYLTATATSSTETTEFSRCALVIGGTDPSIVTHAGDSGLGSLRTAIEYANTHPGADSITFDIPGDGPHTIQPESPLPHIIDTVTIDGLSQPGARCDVWPPTLKIEIQGSIVFTWDYPSNSMHSEVRGLVINHGGILEDAGEMTIQCNFIGTDVTGTVAKGGIGINVKGGGTLIGGIGPGTRNLISGNGDAIYGPEDSGGYLTVQGNYIGTDVTGQFALGNSGSAISLDGATGMKIGGTEPGAGNLISGNGSGINFTFDTDFVDWENSVGSIQGNFIGTDVTGTRAIPNGSGVSILTIPILIGGDEPGARNLISGNSGCGVSAQVFGRVIGMDIRGNYIGTDITGTKPLGNSCGVNTSGGVDIRDNVISGNNGTGASIGLSGDGGDSLQNNIIGADVTGTQPLGNLGDGVSIYPFAAYSFAGVGADHNLIAYNGGAGVSVVGAPDTLIDYGIGGNRIFANGGLGIDLLNDGVTPNDPGDADGNLWGLQNFPDLNPLSNGATLVTGMLNSLPNEIFKIYVYANSACDPSGYGEGETLLGRTEVTTDVQGNVVFGVNVPALKMGQYITATASTWRADSEFSRCVQVMAGPLPPKLRYPNPFGTVSIARTPFSWYIVPSARRYRIQVATDSNFNNLLVDTMEFSTVKAPMTFMPGGYFWRVQTQDTRNIWGAFSEMRYYEYVIMQSPRQNGSSYGAFPIFLWNAYPGARRYQLEIDNNRDFSSPEFVCNYTHRVLSSRPCGPTGLPYGDHYWRVNIDLDSGFIVSPISWTLSVNPRGVVAPIPLTPKGIHSEIVLRFTWSEVLPASYYELQVDNDPAFRNPEIQESRLGGVDWEFILTTPGRYYWRVRAWLSDDAATVWSTTATFEFR